MLILRHHLPDGTFRQPRLDVGDSDPTEDWQATDAADELDDEG
jgi:hypothetical protein